MYTRVRAAAPLSPGNIPTQSPGHDSWLETGYDLNSTGYTDLNGGWYRARVGSFPGLHGLDA